MAASIAASGIVPSGALSSGCGWMEPSTAARFKDNYYDVPMRAEYVAYVIVTNSLVGLSQPLLDRCVVIDVPELSRAERHRALDELAKGRTTITIAHRMSTVRDADEILVFEGGRILERGSFDTLVQQGGRFAELVKTQLTASPPLAAAAPVQAAE